MRAIGLDVQQRFADLAVQLRRQIEGGLPVWLLAAVHSCIIELETVDARELPPSRLIILASEAETLLTVCRASRSDGGY